MPDRATPEVDAYLAALPDDRRAALATLRATILAHLPEGYVESMTWGMPTYEVPLAIYPDTYNRKPLALCAFASKKAHMALYLMCVPAGDAEQAFRDAYRARIGKDPDMGRSCLRFRALEAVPLDLVGETLAAEPLDAYVARERAVRAGA